MERIRNVVRATSREPGRHLRAVASDELGGEVVPKVHSRGDCHSAVRIGTFANDLSAVWQHTRARAIFAEQIANVRVVIVEDVIRQGMREGRGSEIISLYFDLEDAAIGAVFGLDLHGQTGTAPSDDES